ncbi:MAG: response regulator [Candidatus Sericytochromatia bacterium]|nr:response regulator [Candidatus Sericytochromatia bacterium]
MSLSPGIDVLVIEDDADIRDVIVLVLAETGYRVATDANGLAGLDYLRCRPLPRLILLDLAMPVMDGVTFLVAKQSVSIWAPVPVVLMSASHERRVEAAFATVEVFLAKPFGTDRLLTTLAGMIGEPQAA